MKHEDKKRSRRILWYNPPYNDNIRTNIGGTLFYLMQKHFPKGTKYHKLFNKNTVKVSYSCMENIKAIINRTNSTKLRSYNETQTSKKTEQEQKNDKGKMMKKRIKNPNCGCATVEECPLKGQCLTKALVYRVPIA